MARLIWPCRGSPVLAKTSILGFISSAHRQATSNAAKFQHSVKSVLPSRRFLSSKVIHRRNCRLSYPLLYTNQVNRRTICSVATEAQKQADELKMEAPKEIFLRDYKMPDYYFDTVDLKFLLDEDKTTVYSNISVYPRVEASGSVPPLVLDGHDMKLISIKINDQELKAGEYHLDSRHLTIQLPPSGKYTLEIATEIYPQKNTSLEGLYKSTGNFCTQCEAEGFRKITFYQDRPDIMAKYTCRIEADKSKYPVLLSNGNLLEEGELEGGKHFVVWEDPHKKPCYLFALVAGQLVSRDDTFVTRSGRKVALRIWTPAEDLPKTAHAMYSLKAAMKWDEDVFGLEYDLDLFNIVAVPDFNMGAMENKSLNIFNSKLVLASPETATDGDYAAILGVIGHEYFHNWTGNRVTCRDWFQLSLKEGLTVFRDQEFSSDMGSRSVKRISDVSTLRNYQFPQDAGPMAHPVRPHSYIKMDNFYTVTVYEKGAEVVRMYKTLLGSQGFRKGMDLYFKRHDGQAVTCEDFYAAMRDANNADFANFLLWYSQAGTPIVKVTSSYNAETQTFTLKFSQEVPPTPGQPEKEPMFIPVSAGLLNSSGKDIPLTGIYHDGKLEYVGNNTTVLRLTKKEEEFVFADTTEKPVPSLLRGYSAPIRLESDLSDDDLFFLLAHDSDEFNRCGSSLACDKNFGMIEILMEDMEKLGSVPDMWAYNIYLNLLCQENRVDSALVVLESMIQNGREPDVVTYTIIINGLCKVGRINHAVEFWHAMVERKMEPDDKACKALVLGLCYRKKVELAYELVVDLMIKHRAKLSLLVYNALIDGFCKSGRFDKAQALKSYMRKNGCEPDIVTYNILLNYCCDHLMLSEAEMLMENMERRGLGPDMYSYNQFLKGLCKAKRLDRAYLLLDIVETKGLLDVVSYNTLIRGLCDAHDTRRAYQLFEEMGRKGVVPDVVTFSILIKAFLREGSTIVAKKFLDHMTEMGLVLDCILSTTIVDHFCKTDKVDLALSFFFDVVEKGITPDVIMYNAIINGLCKASRVIEALQLFEGMQTQGLCADEVTYKVIIGGLVRENRIPLACRFWDQMMEKGFTLDRGVSESLINAIHRKSAF